jgi:hypothetical protein
MMIDSVAVTPDTIGDVVNNTMLDKTFHKWALPVDEQIKSISQRWADPSCNNLVALVFYIKMVAQ